MKKKGAEFLSIIIAFILVFCSCSIPVYAASNSDYGYNDSYIDNNAVQDKSLYFVPPPPPSDYSNYFIAYSPSKDVYYLYVSNSYVNWFTFLHSTIVNTQGCYLYEASLTSNNWTLTFESHDKYSWAKLPSDFIVVDSTQPCQGYWGAQIITVQKTGYRFYWDLINLFNFVLTYVNYYAA